MLARHVSDLTGPYSGAFYYKLYVQIWYVVLLCVLLDMSSRYEVVGIQSLKNFVYLVGLHIYAFHPFRFYAMWFVLIQETAELYGIEIFTLLATNLLVNNLPCLYRTQEVGVMRFLVLRAVNVKVTVVWDATLCSLVDSY